jgi:hypothetical protein
VAAAFTVDLRSVRFGFVKVSHGRFCFWKKDRAGLGPGYGRALVAIQ